MTMTKAKTFQEWREVYYFKWCRHGAFATSNDCSHILGPGMAAWNIDRQMFCTEHRYSCLLLTYSSSSSELDVVLQARVLGILVSDSLWVCDCLSKLQCTCTWFC